MPLTENSRRNLFLRSNLFDFALALIVSTALVYTAGYGFYSAPALRGNVLVDAFICLLALVPLYAGLWSKRTVAVGLIGYAAVAVCVCVVLGVMMPDGVPLFVDGSVNDTEDNWVVFGMVAVFVPLVVFLLSRRTWGAALLFVLGVLTCAVIQFLYREFMTDLNGLAAALVVYLGCAAIYIYTNYKRNLYAAERVESTSFGKAFLWSLGLSAACLAVGAAVFFGIVASLGITTPDIRPFEDYYQRPTVEYTGVYTEQQIENQDITTNQTNDEQQDSNQNAEGGNQSDSQTEENQSEQSSSRSIMGFDINDWNEQFQAINYRILELTGIIIAIAVVALIIAAILLRRHRRVTRLKRIEGKPPSYRIAYLYNFFLNRFAALGIKRGKTLTPLEFAIASAGRLAPYKRNKSRIDFLEITLLYQRAAYGIGDLTDEDCKRVEDFYWGFFENAREQLGKFKWAFAFWRLS
jgi:hypothetical protein